MFTQLKVLLMRLGITGTTSSAGVRTVSVNGALSVTGALSTTGATTVGGVLKTGSSVHQLTNAAGLIDGAKLQTGTVAAAAVASTAALSVASVATTGNVTAGGLLKAGSGVHELTNAAGLLAGAKLQAGSVASAALAFRPSKWLVQALAAVDTGGGVLSIENDTLIDRLITVASVRVTTAATEACTVDMGVAAADTGSDDSLLDGQDVNAAAGIFTAPCITKVVWPAGEFLTISKATGATAGLVGQAIVEYVELA